MASVAAPTAAAPAVSRRRTGFGPLALRGGVAMYLGLVVALPIAALVWAATKHGPAQFWDDVTDPQSVAALKLTLVASVLVVAFNAVAGVAVAWVLVRDSFRGRRVVDAVVDLPFALPTFVAGLVLLTSYGPSSPIGLDVAFSRVAVVVALLFVTLPFVARAVEPVLKELDRDVEEAAAALGAGPLTTFRRIVLPALTPAILTGCGLAMARALGEFGTLVVLTGNLPFHTEAASVNVFGLIESDAPGAAAAVSVVLLGMALAAQIGFTLLSRRSRRDER